MKPPGGNAHVTKMMTRHPRQLLRTSGPMRQLSNLLQHDIVSRNIVTINGFNGLYIIYVYIYINIIFNYEYVSGAFWSTFTICK